jgi:hypothetical protein
VRIPRLEAAAAFARIKSSLRDGLAEQRASVCADEKPDEQALGRLDARAAGYAVVVMADAGTVED